MNTNIKNNRKYTTKDIQKIYDYLFYVGGQLTDADLVELWTNRDRRTGLRFKLILAQLTNAFHSTKKGTLLDEIKRIKADLEEKKNRFLKIRMTFSLSKTTEDTTTETITETNEFGIMLPKGNESYEGGLSDLQRETMESNAKANEIDTDNIVYDDDFTGGLSKAQRELMEKNAIDEENKWFN